jgi:uncharacterized membrane protein
MTAAAHLWAVGFDDTQRADQVREEITRLGWDEHYLCLLDVAVVVRHSDGSFTVDREPFPAVAYILGCSAVGSPWPTQASDRNSSTRWKR